VCFAPYEAFFGPFRVLPRDVFVEQQPSQFFPAHTCTSFFRRGKGGPSQLSRGYSQVRNHFYGSSVDSHSTGFLVFSTVDFNVFRQREHHTRVLFVSSSGFFPNKGPSATFLCSFLSLFDFCARCHVFRSFTVLNLVKALSLLGDLCFFLSASVDWPVFDLFLMFSRFYVYRGAISLNYALGPGFPTTFWSSPAGSLAVT